MTIFRTQEVKLIEQNFDFFRFVNAWLMNTLEKKPQVKKVLLWLVVGLGGLLLLGGFLLLLMVATGSVEGEEFSPDDFGRRHFSYVRADWFPVTLAGIQYTNITDPLVTSLVNQGLIVPTGNANQKWDLVSDNRMRQDSTAYDAKILCRYLDLRMINGDLVLDDWATKNPEHAKVLWPAVAQLARSGDYSRISLLMEPFVSGQPIDLKDFEAQVTAILAGDPS